MRLIQRLAPRNRLRKPSLALAIGLLSSLAAVWLGRVAIVDSLNDPIYDEAYKLRPADDRGNCPIVIVTANDGSLAALAAGDPKFGWPWPRQFWGFAIDYVQKCGAKAVAVDLLFTEPSIYNRDFADDETFAEKLDAASVPLILGSQAGPDGSPGTFAPPMKRAAAFGAVDVKDAAVARTYPGSTGGMPSLALRIVRAIGAPASQWATGDFRLHYYGHHQYPDGRTTYPYIPAVDVFRSAMPFNGAAAKPPFDPAIFKGKIVLFGTTAAATFDLKTSPLDNLYPGVEIHATAIENMLNNQRVRVVPVGVVLMLTFIASLSAAMGAMTPRQTWMKLMLPGAAALVLVAGAWLLFRRSNIVWLPPVVPLLGTGISTLLALSWSYFAEDRQARFFLKALGQYVSPHVAAELKANPAKLAISTEKGEVTILFSDIVGFTDLSEKLEENIGPLLNFYLDEMSEPVLAENGTLDKYIGDAVMAFWNAPVPQRDHAIRACRAALKMQARLLEIQPQLAELGAEKLSARIGINTGLCMFGNMGSRSKFAYSVIGDSCNFASRLEGANKIYTTSILIGEGTWNLVWDQFITRKVDVLRVKGKQKPVAIFELMGQGLPNPATADLINNYEAAYRLYCRSEWEPAEALLLDILADHPEDGPSRELLGRISDFRAGPPPQFWDGVYVAKEK